MVAEHMEIVYLTDVEGHWDKLAGALAGHAGVALRGDVIDVSEGARLVFGGDATDRGRAGRRIMRALLDAKLRHPDRVTLLAGNRDMNKVRLRVELRGKPPTRAPEEIARGSRPALLRWLFANTMGARDAFAMRAEELGVSGPEADEAVVDSFLDDVDRDGLTTRYLAQCQLGVRLGETLFVHGGVTTESLGHVPGHAGAAAQPTPPDRVDAWLGALNRWYAEQLDAYASARGLDNAAYEPFVLYQAPLPGTRLHQASVVYGRLADAHNNPELPPAEVRAHLRRAGISRLVVGHTPTGDVPVVLRAGQERFELVCADNSYGRLERGPRVVVSGEQLTVEGSARLDSGEEARPLTTLALTEGVGPLGQRDRSTGHLVGARLADDRVYLYRAAGGFVVEQLAQPTAEAARRPLAEPTHDERGEPRG